MPTTEAWLDQNILTTTWNAPLTEDELLACFSTLSQEIENADTNVQVLFDIVDAGKISAAAPMLAVRSGFLTSKTTGQVAVIGMEMGPKVLARIASRISRREIKFFDTFDEAFVYLSEEIPVSE